MEMLSNLINLFAVAAATADMATKLELLILSTGLMFGSSI